MRTPVFFEADDDDEGEIDTMSSPYSSGSISDDSHLFPTPPASNIATSSMPSDTLDEGDWHIQEQDSRVWPGRGGQPDGSLVSENEDGVLILSGDEDDDKSTPSKCPERRRLVFTHLYQTAMDLSIPGTDSLPSDIGSIDVAIRPMSEENDEATVGRDETGSGAAPKRKTAWALVIVCAVLASTLVVVLAFLYLERNTWKSRASMLDQELAETIEQLAQARNQTKAVMGILSDTFKNGGTEDADARATQHEFDWENEDYLASQQVVLAENCWFKATVQLGDCTSNAKDCVSDMTRTMMSSFSNFGKSFYSRSSQAATNPLHMAGATLEGLNEASHLFASATVAAADTMRTAFHVTDKAVLYAVEQTRDAIQDASVTLKVD
mmetsp:Transcript_40809/g.60476  ORF Transcript_40809/g.60476 Transcript_40809/m.60476 type:complete len:380 (-) Transcript_40809:129-1268(-)|eukprot:CAMPEP_0194048220 /NCGR_PEP_ID=MMETSP0009_2-20130614/26793_1 /TAXON_ID=210454 /ORGANISM="Grammatophora oceanica, Strain CCMP 410" /LENGTH=379 /DNA_ID=CAMNT_0038694039 /DNA_START=165 /DNA_END=1304 /DNA_ORIENTATION=-